MKDKDKKRSALAWRRQCVNVDLKGFVHGQLTVSVAMRCHNRRSGSGTFGAVPTMRVTSLLTSERRAERFSPKFSLSVMNTGLISYEIPGLSTMDSITGFRISFMYSRAYANDTDEMSLVE